MRLYEKRRRRRRRQKLVILSIFAICALGLTILLVIGAKTRSGASDEPTEVPEVIRLDLPTVKTTPDTAILPETIEPENSYPRFSYSKDWGAEDSYLLAKISMAEAEGESIQGKTLVILVVLNRVHNADFPNTIQDVIFEENQFTPVINGRFDKVEPDADCWEAVQVVMEAQYDYSDGALYFESCDDANNWHSRNLDFLYQCGNHKFYK